MVPVPFPPSVHLFQSGRHFLSYIPAYTVGSAFLKPSQAGNSHPLKSRGQAVSHHIFLLQLNFFLCKPVGKNKINNQGIMEEGLYCFIRLLKLPGKVHIDL